MVVAEEGMRFFVCYSTRHIGGIPGPSKISYSYFVFCISFGHLCSDLRSLKIQPGGTYE